jgi:hypothetical protein
MPVKKWICVDRIVLAFGLIMATRTHKGQHGSGAAYNSRADKDDSSALPECSFFLILLKNSYPASLSLRVIHRNQR